MSPPSWMVLAVLLIILFCHLTPQLQATGSARHDRRRPSTVIPQTPTPTSTSPTAALPLPTAAQLAWMEGDIGFLIHYNMASYIDTQYDGCNRVPHLVPPISSFAPTALNTDQWVQSMVDAGATYAVLVAKHNCGFATYPTNASVTLADGSRVPYNYTIASAPPLPTADLVASFVRSCRAAGVDVGFYYSVVWNNLLNVNNGEVQPPPLSPGQWNITQAAYEELALTMIAELWGNYGPLREIWFDGGVAGMTASIRDLLQRLQPDAAVFNGLGVTPHAISNSGNEFGFANYDTWSTVDDGGNSSPTGTHFAPFECPTTLQTNDRWFYGGEDFHLRPLRELVDVYHNTVGRNCKLVLDLAVARTGQVEPRHAQRYKQLGDWVRWCYSAPVPSTTNVTCEPEGSGTRCVLDFGREVVVDRVVMREDLRYGQAVRQWWMDGLMDWGDCYGCTLTIPAATGQSIGNKRIALFGEAMTLRAVYLHITQSAGDVHLRSFEAYNCQELD